MSDVRICEMAPRDGLQALNREKPVPVERKAGLIDALATSGLSFIEVGSFVSKRAVPQMADTDELCRGLRLPAGVETAALVPNLKYYQSFKSAGLSTVALFVSASESYSQINLRCSIAESMAAAEETARAAVADGFRLRAHLSAVFHDIDDGDSDIGTVIDLTHRLVEWGCDHVSLADTKGTTHPGRVREVLGAVLQEVDRRHVAAHFHDSFGLGIANALAAFECGVSILDGSVGGIGGTPFRERAKGAGGGGNVATEELVCLFEKMGVATGVDSDALLRAGEMVSSIVADTGDRRPLSKLLN